jgi:chorismate mutase
MDIEDWRKRIDEIDLQFVALINERAKAASAIGELKRQVALPIYEPQREQRVFENVCRVNRGPLRDRDLLQIYERIMDVMRKLQREQNGAPGRDAAPTSATELEASANE